MESKYVRYQAGIPNSRGRHPGIFNLANGLAREGRLSSRDWASCRRSNDHYDSAYLNPSTVDKSIYDHESTQLGSSAQPGIYSSALSSTRTF
jgi:hypothetical protein